MERGKRVAVHGLVTHWGKLDVEAASSGDAIDVRLASERTPRRIALRLPHPEGKTAVRVSAGTYDPATETVWFENVNEAAVRLEFVNP